MKTKKKLCFFLSETDRHYQGAARPFINWAAELAPEHYEIHFMLLRCGREIEEYIKTNLNNVGLRRVKNFNQILGYLNSLKPDLLISDDHYPRLRLVTKIKDQIQITTCIYVIILFGSHSIGDVFKLNSLSLKQKITFGLSRCIPFYFLKLPYKNLLLKQNIIAACSQTTAMLLHTMYGVKPQKVIYPPVNTRQFKICKVEKRNQVLVYLGSYGGDTDASLVRKICTILQDRGFDILVLGSNDLAKKNLQTGIKIQHLSNLTDEELARIYSETSLTICPQEWEMFGYTVAESVSCGTPVLAFNCSGPGEILSHVNIGFLADNEEQLLKQIESFNTKEIEKDKEVYPWDIVVSTKKLEFLVQKYCNFSKS
jgi:glycosyltransferase involved in cell wall biosynthesis